MTGKPYTGLDCPCGVGAGVVCSRASFCAKLRPLLFSLLLVERVLWSRNSVTRKEPGEFESLPWARLRGQREGTALWIALRDSCSPLWGFYIGVSSLLNCFSFCF